jgi:hypothetical protein
MSDHEDVKPVNNDIKPDVDDITPEAASNTLPHRYDNYFWVLWLKE